MATIILFLLLTFAVSLFVVYPIVTSRTRFARGSVGASNHKATDLIERKENIYAQIKDIEFDYQTGKLSETDFQGLRQQYKNEAIQILKQIDSRQKQVRGRRKGSKKAKKGNGKAANYCWACGMAVIASDKYCANCGNNIR